LYEYLWAYNGDQMARELNMESKHSIEKQTAHHVDCFTTVSDITAKECQELLDKSVDVILPNGFEDDFVPKGAKFTAKRSAARKKLLSVANALTGSDVADDALIISTSGRYEFRNKGIDVFIEAINRLRFDDRLNKQVVAFIEVPGWLAGPRQDLAERIASGDHFDSPLELQNAIKSKNANQKLGISRLVATYDWPYVRENKKQATPKWFVEIGNWKAPWNLQLEPEKEFDKLSWIEQPQTINEVGSTFTVQGFDLNYVGVIIGPSVKYRNGKIIYDISESKNKGAVQNRKLANGKKVNYGESLLRNELNVLLTRGVNGLYIYAVDEELREALKKVL